MKQVTAEQAYEPDRSEGKRRLIAMLVMVLIILVGTVTAGRNTLDDLRWDAMQVFYSGICYDDAGIYGELDNRIASAGELVELAKTHRLENRLEVKTVQSACENLEQAYSPAGWYEENERLSAACDDLLTVLPASDWSEEDQQQVERLAAELQSANERISQSPYNEKAAEFNRILEQFPAKILKGGVEKLEFFAPNGNQP